MALSTAKLTELQPHLLSTFTIPRKTQHYFTLHLFKPLSSSSLRSTKIPKTPSTNPNTPKQQPSSSSWIKKWPSQPPPQHAKSNSKRPEPKPEPIREKTTAIDRIVLRLRNLGLGSDDEDEELDLGVKNGGLSDLDGAGNVELGNEKLGDLLRRDWVRPDTFLAEDEGGDYHDDSALLPWERGASEGEEVGVGKDGLGVKRRVMRAPTLAELTIEDEELRRLRRNGMTLRERVNVPKAGITGAVLEKIHDQWRKCELVRLKFHEELAHDMRTAHEIVEVGEFCGVWEWFRR